MGEIRRAHGYAQNSGATVKPGCSLSQRRWTDNMQKTFKCGLQSHFLADCRGERIGASEGIRTLDIHLGKVTLYQTELRSLPKKLRSK